MSREKIVKKTVGLLPAETLSRIQDSLDKLSNRLGVSKTIDQGNTDQNLFIVLQTRLGKQFKITVDFDNDFAVIKTETPEEMGPEDLVVSKIEELIEETLNNNEAL